MWSRKRSNGRLLPSLFISLLALAGISFSTASCSPPPPAARLETQPAADISVGAIGPDTISVVFAHAGERGRQLPYEGRAEDRIERDAEGNDWLIRGDRIVGVLVGPGLSGWSLGPLCRRADVRKPASTTPELPAPSSEDAAAGRGWSRGGLSQEPPHGSLGSRERDGSPGNIPFYLRFPAPSGRGRLIVSPSEAGISPASTSPGGPAS